MRVGRHIGPGGKQSLSTLQAYSSRLSAFQLFAGGRINRKISYPPESDWPQIKALVKERGLYAMIHAAYVINLCQDPQQQLSVLSRQHLVEVLQWGERMGILNINFHPGSAKDLDLSQGEGYLVENCQLVLQQYQGPAKLLLENSSGSKAGKKVGADLSTLDQLAKAIGPQKRVAVCVDTTHAFAAGYPLDQIADECLQMKRLEAVHFNPPKSDLQCGSFLDRHGTLNDSCWNKEQCLALARQLSAFPLVMETADSDDPEQLLDLLQT